jgi:hypothetical protein
MSQEEALARLHDKLAECEEAANVKSLGRMIEVGTPEHAVLELSRVLQNALLTVGYEIALAIRETAEASTTEVAKAA